MTAVVVAALGCALLTFAILSLSKSEAEKEAPQKPVNLSKLAASSTHTTLKRAPKDPNPTKATTGLVVHPTRVTALYDEPNGTPFGKIKPKQFGDTWLPAIERTDGWVRVLLPSRPNGATGWVKSVFVRESVTPYLIKVHVGSRQIELYQDKILKGVWPIAVGAAATPTPTGRTFVLGQLTDSAQSFSPIILPLGFHSQTLDTYGGGPGTVAIHGWPNSSVFGQAVSHGCIRVPAEALEQMRAVPIGTIVLIDNQ